MQYVLLIHAAESRYANATPAENEATGEMPPAARIVVTSVFATRTATESWVCVVEGERK